MSNIHSLSAVNEASGFNQLSIKIGDIEITPELITELSFDLNGEFRIFGTLTINDHYDIHTEGKLEVGSILTVSIIDLYNDILLREFNIIKVAEEKVQDFKILKFNLQDVVSYKLEQTYIDKSYSNTSLTTIFEDFLSLEINSLISKFDIKKLFDKTIQLNNFCIPINVSFLDFMITEFDRQGVYFYQDLFNIIIGSPIIPDGKYEYKAVGAHNLYGFNIMEHKLLTNNVQENLKLPKTDFIVFNKAKKSMTSYNKSFTDYKNELNIDTNIGIVKELQLTNGLRYKTKEYLMDDTKYKVKVFNNTNILSIVVPGNLKQVRLYQVVDIRLSGNILSVSTIEKGDQKMSGKYMVYRIETKVLLGQKIINKITLKRTIEGKQN